MSTDEYVPSDEDMIHWFEGEENPELARDLWNTWLAAHDARVRRDAAREALIEFRRTELAIIPPDAEEDDPIRTRQQALAWRIEMHLLGNHPEEATP